MELLESLSNQFNSQVKLREVRPHTRQIIVPLFHEDGDMVDIFLDDIEGSDRVRVCDHGLTLMRLAYNYDIDTPAQMKVFERILSENEVEDEDGNLYIDARMDNLYPAILQFAQAIAKISSMRVHTREVVRSMFLEDLQHAILDGMTNLQPEKDTAPDEARPELVVDYVLQTGASPIYLFGVNNNDKAHLVTITCQSFLLAERRFTSWVVHENFDTISTRERSFLTNAVMKQFTTLSQFIIERDRFLRAEAI